MSPFTFGMGHMHVGGHWSWPPATLGKFFDFGGLLIDTGVSDEAIFGNQSRNSSARARGRQFCKQPPQELGHRKGLVAVRVCVCTWGRCFNLFSSRWLIIDL